MPTIAHALLGGAVALIFYTLSIKWGFQNEKKFTERMVIVFALNSMIGPDIFTMFLAFHIDTSSIPIKPFVHSILGWPIWCLFIMWLWYYVINIRSTEQTRLSKRSTLLLLIAAGEMHFYLDLLDDGVNLIAFSSWNVHLTLEENFLTGASYEFGPLHDMMPWFSMTEMFLIGIFFMILLIYSLFRWELKYTYLISTLFLVSLFVLYFLFGSIIFGFENDIGVTLYFGLLFLIPLTMMILAME